jgi:hypothetical protein
MIKAPIKRPTDISTGTTIVAMGDEKSSLERLQLYFAMIWVSNQTDGEKESYLKEMERIKNYDEYTSKNQKLYDYYELHAWPIVLQKLDKLKKKYSKY